MTEVGCQISEHLLVGVPKILGVVNVNIAVEQNMQVQNADLAAIHIPRPNLDAEVVDLPDTQHFQSAAEYRQDRHNDEDRADREARPTISNWWRAGCNAPLLIAEGVHPFE